VGTLLDTGGYRGEVLIALAMTGILGASSWAFQVRPGLFEWELEQYRRHVRHPTGSLVSDPRAAAANLVLPLVRELTRRRHGTRSPDWVRDEQRAARIG